jgi:ribosomal protein S12 methylthiotransferase
MEVLDVMNKKANVCKYLDMPLQHISDSMLRSMKRGITKQKTIELVDTIRNKVPGIHIRTTLIAGYPGETEQDHEEMLSWVEKTRFERLGIFTYSHEENTSAYKLQDTLSQELKKKRADAVMAVQQEISLQHNQEKIGKPLRVLFDRKENHFLIGRTEFDSPDVDNEVLVKISKNTSVEPGDFATVMITEGSDFDLYGDIIP